MGPSIDEPNSDEGSPTVPALPDLRCAGAEALLVGQKAFQDRSENRVVDMQASPKTVRLWTAADLKEENVSHVLQALAQRGLCPRPAGDAPSAGPGLMLVESVTEEVLGRVATFSRAGFERVLVVVWKKINRKDTWCLLQAGASDVLVWSDVEHPEALMAACFRRWDEIDQLTKAPIVRNNIIGESRVWTAILRQVVEVAAFSEASVLITGESGTGKELIARLIHTLDRRPDKQQLVVLDCTTVVPELSGSEFFGHEKGAFTGAVAARDGAFALADRGTLFLDEIGDLPLALQAELLRAIQERTYKRVGSNTWRETNFRLVCATNRPLHQEERRGAFRHDLYYRIASWTITLPPLRQRREDILPLAYHFLRQMDPDRDPPELSKTVADYLLSRDYAGNVRELRQLVRRLAWRHAGRGLITPGAIPAEERPDGEGHPRGWQDIGFEQAIRRALSLGVGLKGISRESADAAVRIALEEAGGSVKQAANRLGVTRRALQLRRAQKANASNGVKRITA